MDKQIITFSANEQNLVRIGGEYHYSSNKVSYIGAHFDLGANWDGFDSVRAVWFTDRINGISTVLDGEGNCTVPTEVLKKKDRVFVNLVGSIVSNGELTDRLTTYPAVALVVDSKAKVDSTETAPVTPSQFEQFVSIVQDAVANIKDIVSTTLNADYTLTFVYSDGTSYTTPSIRGERGPQGTDGADGTDGNGIASAVLNSNYTLTLTFTDGTSYTTPSIRGAQGPKGEPGDVSQAQLDAAVSDLKSDLNTEDELLSEVLNFNFGIEEESLVQGYSSNNTSSAIIANSPYVIRQNISGSLIKSIRLKVATSGKLTIGYKLTEPVAGDTSFDIDNDFIFNNELMISNVGEQTIVLPHPFVLPDGCYLAVGLPTDTCVWCYGNNGSSTQFYYYYRAQTKWVLNDNSLGLDVIGFEIVDYKSIFNDYPTTKDKADFTWTAQCESADFYDGYNSLNTNISGASTAPFMVIPSESGFITSIKLKIYSTGNLSIGTIKASDVVLGQTFDFSKVNVHEVLTFTTSGEQIKQLSTPMGVESGELIVLTIRTDTASFNYGSLGTDTGFNFVTSESKVSVSGNSLGVTFSGFAMRDVRSVYKNKTISILGDSISTFAGYIPEGNATYYPSGTVQAVTDTWWKKLIDALGITLNVNNSWSGSRVTTTAGETSAGCMTRCQSLGTNPDVIIVWMGINDFNNEVALGTYDGTTALPSVTTTFREAYAIMLNKILTAYPSAEVWVCTLPQCERNAETGFPEINGNGVALAEFNKAILELANAFGVKVLDHNKCGLTYQNMPTFNPDNLHPNKYGHSLVANNDIRQMDAAVRLRYPIA